MEPSADSSNASRDSSGFAQAPSLALPKGGGAVRGIGEKFAANPVTGTGSLTIPIATSPGRSGFGPQLALSYDSGSGNGPFDFGWSLSTPPISRKTDKGLPLSVRLLNGVHKRLGQRTLRTRVGPLPARDHTQDGQGAPLLPR